MQCLSLMLAGIRWSHLLPPSCLGGVYANLTHSHLHRLTRGPRRLRRVECGCQTRRGDDAGEFGKSRMFEGHRQSHSERRRGLRSIWTLIFKRRYLRHRLDHGERSVADFGSFHHCSLVGIGLPGGAAPGGLGYVLWRPGSPRVRALISARPHSRLPQGFAAHPARSSPTTRR